MIIRIFNMYALKVHTISMIPFPLLILKSINILIDKYKICLYWKSNYNWISQSNYIITQSFEDNGKIWCTDMMEFFSCDQYAFINWSLDRNSQKWMIFLQTIKSRILIFIVYLIWFCTTGKYVLHFFYKPLFKLSHY